MSEHPEAGARSDTRTRQALLAGAKVLMGNQRFAVEFDRRTVGIAVRVPGGFMFYASDHRFDVIDGRLFRRARAIERELKALAGRKPRPGLQAAFAA